MPARLLKYRLPEIAIFAVAVFLRLWMLDIKPPHFDEGVNGWFADQMTRTGFYQYDPTNYHGPLHFYAVFLSQTLFGRHLWALRLPAIVANLLAILAIFRYREFFGAAVVRFVALAMAVSPAFVFYGRYSIHESWQVLFSILFFWGVLGLWEKGERRFLYTVILCAAGMVVTKETYALHIGCVVLAAVALWVWQRVFPSRPQLRIARQLWAWRDLGVAAALAVLCIVAFYSGFFLNIPGLSGLLTAFSSWFHTGVDAAGHAKTAYQIGPLNYYWVALMARYEWPALAGLVACLWYVFPSDARIRLLAISAGGVLIAYSIIPYKTPWCIISILWPFYIVLAALLAGIKGVMIRRLAWLGALVLVAVSLGKSIKLNYVHYTDAAEPYVYVQTFPEVDILTAPVLGMARQNPAYYGVDGHILLESYYPLPWILGDFPHVGYYKKDSMPSPADAAFIAVERSREKDVEQKLQHAYYKRHFRLRDAQEECTAYFQADVYAPWFKSPPDLTSKP